MRNFIKENPALLREKGTAADNAGDYEKAALFLKPSKKEETKVPTMSEAAAYEFLRRALYIGGATLADFHTTEAAENILFYAIFNGRADNEKN